MDLGDTLGLDGISWVQKRTDTYAELDVGGEVLDTLLGVKGRLDERGLNDTRLAVQGANDGVGEAGTGCNVSYNPEGRTRTHQSPWRG